MSTQFLCKGYGIELQADSDLSARVYWAYASEIRSRSAAFDSALRSPIFLAVSLSLLTTRICSIAISDCLPLSSIWSRVRQVGWIVLVSGHITTVSRMMFNSSRLTITAGRVFLSLRPRVGSKLTQ